MKPRFFSLKHLILILIVLLFAAGNPLAISAPYRNPANDLSRNLISELFRRHAMESLPGQLGEAPVFADFDGDQKEDMAIARLSKDRYEIVVLLSRRSEAAVLNPSVRLTGFKVHAYDINNDSNQDVVVTDAIENHPLAVWLGDGQGNFEIADQNLFKNAFEFAEPSGYQNIQLSPDQDSFDETSGPTFGKTARLTVNPELEPMGFITLRTNTSTLRKAYASIAPRSPPTIHHSKTMHLKF